MIVILLDAYKIIYGGDGKVVALKSTERKGRAAYSYGVEIEEDGEFIKERQSIYLYLHKPKGSNKLEIIR